MYADDVTRAMAEALRPRFANSAFPFPLRRRDGQVIVPAHTAMSDAHLALIANSIREGSFGSFAEAGVEERQAVRDILRCIVEVGSPETAEAAQDAADDLPGESVNGLRVLGEWDGADATFQDFNVLLTPLDWDGLVAQLSELPPGQASRLSDLPVRWRRIDPGHMLNDKTKLYDQTAKNFMFYYVFSGPTSMTWKQLQKGVPGVLRTSSIRSDMFRRMTTQSGNEWEPTLYTATKNIRKAGDFEVVWAPTADFAAIDGKNGKQAQAGAVAAVEGQLAANRAGARKLSAAERAQRRQRQVRKYIEEQVYRRLMAEVVNRLRVRRNIIVASNPADYIWEGGPNGEHAGYQGKMFSKGSAAALAKHYDDFQFTGRNRVNRRGDTRKNYNGVDDRVEATISQICDPAQYGVPPDDEPEEPMTPEEVATLERALVSAKNFLLGTGIEIQIAQPGHRPKYNFIPGQYGSRQGSGWPIDDVRRFVVMFTGLDFQKRFGDDALRYLDAAGLRRVVEPAFRAASEAYGDGLQLAVVTDNGVERG